MPVAMGDRVGTVPALPGFVHRAPAKRVSYEGSRSCGGRSVRPPSKIPLAIFLRLALHHDFLLEADRQELAGQGRQAAVRHLADARGLVAHLLRHLGGAIAEAV